MIQQKKIRRRSTMLKDNLKVLLGSTFVEYTKIHSFHFNVEGSNFPQYHDFLGKYYSEVYETIDVIGEYIRTLDSYTPNTLSKMLELSIVDEQQKIPRAELMFVELLDDAEKLLVLVTSLFNQAESENKQDIANYMAHLQNLYSKKRWMLRSILNKTRE